jgi:Subtilase family
VLEGGNFSIAGDDTVDSPDDLALLTTRHDFVLGGRLFNHFADTSAATALAAGMVARIRHEYPTLWPETIRALLVHSASWTPAMLAALDKNPKKRDLENLLLRRYGFGVPNLERAMYSAKNHLTLIFEDDLQPFYKSGSDIKTFQMKTHLLGWKDVLESLGETQVSLKVTLSYFIEPNPGRRGNIPRFGYASHDLRFEVKRPEESLATFKHRINKNGSTINAQNKPDLSEDNIGWFLGSTFRKRGSLLSDTWTGNAAELASRDAIVVYPASGWWKERKSHGRYDRKARYALAVSLQVETDVDIYAQITTAIAVANKATVKPQVPVEIDVSTH